MNSIETDKIRNVKTFLRYYLNLHPILTWGVIIIDLLLFHLEIFSGGLLLFVSVIIGLILGIAGFIIQRYECRDSNYLALAKALMVFVIVSIPTSILSLVLLPFALMGSGEGYIEESD